MSPRQIGLLAALSAIWGGSYLLIKYALEDLSAPMVVWSRVAVAAVVLLVLIRSTMGSGAVRQVGNELRDRPRSGLLLGTLAVALPFTLITLGELEVPSGLTAVLISPASLFVALFAPWIDPSERVDRRQGVGIVLGLAGVALVVGVESVHSLGELLGALAMIGAAASYGLSSFVVKRRYGHLAAMQTSLVSIFVTTVLTAPLALATLPSALPGARALLSVLVLGAVGTALAFVIFYKLINEVGAGRASLVSYLAPGVALFYGALLLDEAITAAAIAGLALILGGVALAGRKRVTPSGSAGRRSASPRRPPRDRPLRRAA
ncbi:MAG TPA: DMT family transporter [Solirubrobacteraceae bacterium]|jgi:drug/metabolite transporter (DMT)-like permease|nr:DMT family transporter [Solirubrobacteraceae bacterium]